METAREGEAPAPTGWCRRRRLVVIVVALVVIVGLLTSGLRIGDRNRPELTHRQWQRIVDEFARIAAGETRSPAVRQPTAAGDAPTANAAAATDGDEPNPTLEPAQDPTMAGPRRAPVPTVDAETLAAQADEYATDRPRSIVALQPFRHTASIDVVGAAGRQGTARLINLNPRINSWYVLELRWEGESAALYHLANGEPGGQALILSPDFPSGIVIDGGVAPVRCDLWSSAAARPIASAAAVDSPYVLLCDERITLRLPTAGRKTAMERVTDFLRDNVWGGEQITVFVRQTLFQDAYLEAAERVTAAGSQGAEAAPDAPRPARVDAASEGQLLTPTELGLLIEGAERGQMRVGRWYASRGNPGIWVSALEPGIVDRDILGSHSEVVIRLDEVEMEALAYLVAFDLDLFELGFALGTDHPRVGWSDRVPPERRNPALPGPDGFETIAPLVSTGIMPPSVAPRAVATFTGGFKRTHGAFRYGELSTVNNGSHYGFIENGVVFSKLQPGLSTIYVLDDGAVDMKTWTASDRQMLDRIRFARQNGVPIIEYDETSGTGIPGADVSRYGAGNWSGSQDGRYRTLRAGACLQETERRRFLVYGYFSSATPSAMARVFQAYGCRYAMLLDMNALEHTYLAVYWLRGTELGVQHLVQGMSVLDRSHGGRLLPRFLGYADNRDFFYLMRRGPRGRGQEIDP